MKKSIKFLMAISLCLSILCPPQLLRAQQTSPFDSGAKSRLKLPKNAIAGSNAERKAAWDKLSEDEKNQHINKFKSILEQAKTKKQKSEKPLDTVLTFLTPNKQKRLVRAETRETLKSKDGAPAAALRLLPEPCEGCEPPFPDPDPTPNPGNQSSPVGHLDLIDINTATVQGWTFDPDNSSASNEVHIYIDGPAGQGTFAGSTIANVPRPDVNNAFGVAGDHGFSVQIPPQYANGQPHSVFAYGIDTGANPPTLLSNSPLYFTINGNPPPPPPPPTGNDNDADGLNDGFEAALADGFTPFYHISAGERAGTGFAIFNNSLPLSVNQLFGPVPPISYYRVKPLGMGSINGVQHSYIQLDYLSLWNRDDGLVSGNLCYVLATGLGIILDELGDHLHDRERSAILVAAPSVNGGFNTNASDYKAYRFFTAAHEDTFFDHSLLFYPQTPVNYGLHVELGSSLSKHALYPYNPDYQTLIPDYVIFSTYVTFDIWYQEGVIDILQYLSLLYLADTVFFACAIEHFQEQGGSFAGLRINVGELSQPINNSNFILDSELAGKLQKLF